MSGLNIQPAPALLPEALTQRASRLSSANLCDGMKNTDINREGAMSADVLPIKMDMKCIGTAFTLETSGGNNFPIHLALYSEGKKDGYVLVIDGKSCRDIPYLGDLIAATAKAVGFAAIVISGCVRDRESIAQMGYPVFCEGFVQRGPKKIAEGAINVPILCGGVDVRPGDLVVGDADGVTVVPRDRVEEVLENAEKKVAYEEKRRLAIDEYVCRRRAALPLNDITPDWVKEILSSR